MLGSTDKPVLIPPGNRGTSPGNWGTSPGNRGTSAEAEVEKTELRP